MQRTCDMWTNKRTRGPGCMAGFLLVHSLVLGANAKEPDITNKATERVVQLAAQGGEHGRKLQPEMGVPAAGTLPTKESMDEMMHALEMVKNAAGITGNEDANSAETAAGAALLNSTIKIYEPSMAPTPVFRPTEHLENARRLQGGCMCPTDFPYCEDSRIAGMMCSARRPIVLDDPTIRDLVQDCGGAALGDTQCTSDCTGNCTPRPWSSTSESDTSGSSDSSPVSIIAGAAGAAVLFLLVIGIVLRRRQKGSFGEAFGPKWCTDGDPTPRAWAMGFVCAGGLVAFIFCMVGLGNPIDSCLWQMKQEHNEHNRNEPFDREMRIGDCEKRFAAYRTGGAAGIYGCLFFITVIFFWDSLVKVNEWCINTQRG